MANKQKLSLDDMGLGDSFSDATMDWEATPIKAKRHPVGDLGKIAAKGAVSGLADGAFIRQQVKKNFPEGYGSALDFADETAVTFKSLYNTAATEMRPLTNDLKRGVQRLMPSIGDRLPTKVKNSLDSWSKNIDGDGHRYNPEDAKNLQIQQAQQEIFQYEFKQRQDDRTEGKAKEEIKEGIEQSRFKTSASLLNQISLSTQALAQYQQKVEVNYQRKMLELSYRQVYLLRDTHEEQKRLGAIITEGFKSVIHNTGLPDYEKLTAKNRAGGFVRNQFASMAGSGLRSARLAFMGKLRQSAESQIKSRIGSFVNKAQTGFMMGNQLLDMKEQSDSMREAMAGMEDLGMEPDYGMTGLGASMAGGWAAQLGGVRAMKWVKQYLDKNPHIIKRGNQMQGILENLPQHAHRFANSNMGEGRNPILDALLGLGKDTINDALKQGPTNLHRSDYSNLQEAAVFTNQANKSITEIIPGYLARILREVTISRTGDDKTPLMTYDYQKNRFDTQRNAEKNALGNAFSSYGLQDLKSRTNSIASLIEDPEQPFTSEEKKALAQHLMTLHRRGGGIADKATLGNVHNYRGEMAQHGDRLSGAFNRYFGDDASNAKHVQMSRQVNALSMGIEERKAVIQDLANAGHLEMLIRAGVVDAKGENIDMDRFYALHLEDDPVMAAIGEELESVAGDTPQRMNLNMGRRRRRTLHVRPIPRRVSRTSVPITPQAAPAGAYEFQGPPHPPINNQAARTAFNWNDAEKPIQSATERLHEDLLRIEALVQAGTKITVARMKVSGIPMPDLDKISDHIDGLSQSGKAHLGKAKSFFDRTLREHYQSAKTRGQQGMDYLKNQAPKARDFAQTQYENLRDRGRRGWGKFQDTKNVYLPGEKMPRLMTAKLKAGEYLDDATGKVLESYKDIRGAVRDRITNELVLTDDEAKSAFIRLGPVQKTLSALGAIIRPIRDAAERALEHAQGAALSAAALARRGIQRVRDYLDGPQDIYVAGESEPVLLARIMRAGGYRLKMDPTKVVSKITEISGPVIDATGDEVLSMEDLKKGLFDKFGRPLKTGWMRGAQMIQDHLHRVFNYTAKKLGDGLRQAKDAGMTLGRKAAAGARECWDRVAKWIGTDGFIIAGGQTIVERLTEIRDFLYQSRRDGQGGEGGQGSGGPSGPSRYRRGQIHRGRNGSRNDVAGDRDGDGIRDGSTEDIRAHRAQARSEALKTKEEKELADIDKELGAGGPIAAAIASLSKKMKGGAKEAGGGLLNLLGGLAEGIPGVGKLLKKIPGGKLLSKIPGWGKLAGAGSGLVSAAEAAAAGEGIAAAGGAVAGAAGKAAMLRGAASRAAGALGRGAVGAASTVAEHGLVGGAARLAGKGAMTAATAVPGLLWKGAKMAGTAGKWLLNARKMGGPLGFLLGGAGDAVGGLALDGLGMAAGGLMSVLASPVVLGAAALAVTGAGLYASYKGISKFYGNHKTLDKPTAMRFAQYGFLKDDHDHRQAVFQLEEMLTANVHYDSKGMAILDMKKIVPHNLFKLFGLDPKDKDQLHNFATWFVKRFKPVYLTHLTILRKLTGSSNMGAVDKLKGDQKKEYLNAAKYPDGPYDQSTSPFPDLKSLPAGPRDVAKAAEEALKEVDAKKGDGKDVKRAVDGKGILPAKSVKAGTPDKPLDAKGQLVAKALTGNLKDPTARAVGQTARVAGAIVAGSTLSATRGVDAMTAVRMKAYGLTNMEPEKVSALLQVEQIVEDRLTVAPAPGPQRGTGNKPMQAIYQGDDMAVLHQVGSRFDVIGEAGDGAFAWRRWFAGRFLPTYLAYRGALATQTGQTKKSAAENQLVGSPAQAVLVAQAVVGAQAPSKFGGGAVWKQSMSPWPKYELNPDASTTKENVQALNARTGREHLPEAKAKLVAKADTKPTQQQSEKKTDTSSMWDSMKKSVSDSWNGVKSAVSNAWEGAKKVGSSVADAAGSAVKAGAAGLSKAGNAVSSATSAAWEGVKSGTKYVASKITASAAAIKASILKALGAAGITNPTEMAMFMAQMDTESGGFKSLSENLNYKPSRLMQVFPKYFRTAADAEQVAGGGEEAIANRIYGGRMGNTAPGDGYKYRGRGVIQLTGKDNYARYGKLIGVDLVSNPDAASDPMTAAKIAIAYWKSRVSSQAAQAGDVKSVTKAINGGTIGLADRQAKFQMYMSQAKNGQLAAAANAAGGTAAAGAPGSPADSKAGGATGTGSPAGFGGSTPSIVGTAPAAGSATADSMTQAKAVTAAAPAPKSGSGTGSPSGFGGSSPTPGMPAVPNPIAPTVASSHPVPSGNSLTQDMGNAAEQLKTLKSIEQHLAEIKTLIAKPSGQGGGAGQVGGGRATPAGGLAAATEMARGPISMAKSTFGVS